MAIKELFVLLFLTLHITCEKNSLTFVIDDTSSMSDEIRQVKDASKSIVDIVVNEKTTQIHDIVLVTFNDPDISFRKRTRNDKELKNALEAIRVHGGGDCPEMSLTGIKKALLESQQGSYLFVFSDASAKDYRQFEDIRSLAQEKQSQIVFILTGYCSDASKESNDVYHRIAQDSNGQVFRVNKNEIGQVLEYVKETIRGDRTVITSIIVPPHRDWKGIKFNVDDKTEYAIVSASGANVEMQIRDPHHKLMMHNKYVTYTRNVKVMKLANLEPGTYTVYVKGNSEVNIMIFGRTDFTFEHGFSENKESSLRTTVTQPTIGVKSHLMIAVKDPESSVDVKSLQILDMKENVIMKLGLTRVQGNVYATEKFMSPEENFKIAVIATSKNTHKDIRRIGKTPVKPVKPVEEAPEISKTDKIFKVKEGESIDLPCRVRGKPKPVIKWYLKQQDSSIFQELKGENDATLHVRNAMTSDHYKCEATNKVGSDHHTLQLDVQARPEFVNTPNEITINEGEPVTIECRLSRGNPRPEVIGWQFKRVGWSEFRHFKHAAEKLVIPAALPEQAGEYQCRAENKYGHREKITTLIIRGKPVIEIPKPVIEAMEHTTVTLQCKVTRGFPKPTVNWYRVGPSGSYQMISSGSEELTLKNIQLNNAGKYKCVAKNTLGSAEGHVEVIVNGKPVIEIPKLVIEAMEHTTVTLLCKVTRGFPKPTVNWYRVGPSDSYQMISSGSEELTLKNIQLNTAGKYKCIAKNTLGSAEGHLQVIVNGKPVIDIPKPVIEAMEHTTVTLLCKVTRGFPKPTVNWYRVGPSGSYQMISSGSEELTLKNIQLNTAGKYKCVAENTLGSAEGPVQVIVNAPPRILSDISHYEGVEGDVVMKLPCAAVGHPTPAIRWEVDERVVGSDKSKEMYVEDNALILKNPMEKHSTDAGHTYVCRARNKIDTAAQTCNVTIAKYPDHGQTNVTYGVHKQPYDVQCPLPYTDPNSVRWFKNSVNLHKTGPTLHIETPTHADNGNYTCRVSDLKGAMSHTVEVFFGYPPTREKNRLSFNKDWQGDSSETIDCATPQDPEGKYTWFYNGEKLGENSKSLSLTGWGHYTCNVSNPLGSLVINFEVTGRDCGIPTSLFETKHTPIILNPSYEWPSLKNGGKYIIVPKSEKLMLFCQGQDLGKTSTSFTKFPHLKSVVATCDHEESFLVDGSPMKFSELDCKNNVAYRLQDTSKACLGENTKLYKIGYNLQGADKKFITVYESCKDTIKNVPLYTKIKTIPVEASSEVNTRLGKRACVDESKCCYESIQLVNEKDVGFGPPQKATHIDSFNSVKYCKPKNLTSWYKLEAISRSEIQFIVWSGAAKYEKIGTTWTPKYLWKVLKDVDSKEMLIIIHENGLPGKKLCAGDCGGWFEPEGDRTYCCKLEDFKKSLGITINFDDMSI